MDRPQRRSRTTDVDPRPTGRRVVAPKHRRRHDRRPALLVYTAVQILVGIVAFAWVAVSFPIAETISLTSTGGREGILLGLVFWIAIGLLGGTRVERLRGHGVLTFHVPFIIAAMALGGVAAGAVVAMVSTIEARELREAPWYGVLANHAALTVGAIVGGLTLVVARDALGSGILGVDPNATELVAIVLGALALTLTSTVLVAGTVILRERLTIAEAVQVFDSAYRITAANEVVLGWMLAFTFAKVGWWGTAICATLILVVWRAYDALEQAGRDPMTGLMTRGIFDRRLQKAIDGSQRGGQLSALIAIDLDGFKAVNDKHGHNAGDDVIRAIGGRLRQEIRLTDAAVRRGGDEFSVLLADVPDAAAVKSIARRIHARLRQPIDTGAGPVTVGASIGVWFVTEQDQAPVPGRLHDLADGLMYAAKARGGGARFGPLG
jgi:diguanylate cyclase (GGDEF)-like protein